MVTTIFVLLIVYQIKHFLADYPLQGAYMLKKFMGGWQWVLPLAAHAGVHGLFTLAITLLVNPVLWWLALVDFVAHFVMDRVKASPNLLGRYKAISGNEFMEIKPLLEDVQRWQGAGFTHLPDDHKDAVARMKSNVYFWWSLGLDQMVHHLTHYYIIWVLVS
jgi:hypothetical protein